MCAWSQMARKTRLDTGFEEAFNTDYGWSGSLGSLSLQEQIKCQKRILGQKPAKARE